MTVSYNLEVGKTRPWTMFQLLFRWRGSVWKAVLPELCVWLIAYAIISVLYRCGVFGGRDNRTFEQLVAYLNYSLSLIPLEFLVGFFITVVVERWNRVFSQIGFIDTVALTLAATLRGSDDESRLQRRSIIRYCVLSQVLIFRDVSMQVRRRFPTIDAVQAAGLMTENERLLCESATTRYSKYMLPFQWAMSHLVDARDQEKIRADVILSAQIKEIRDFYDSLHMICNHDWVPLPLVYPQVVTFAVHSYFFICLIARQFPRGGIQVEGDKFEIDLVFPIMTVLQFIFYFGWMKVASALLNPLGEDDDDFECNYIIDRNLALGFAIVDENYEKTPPPEKDVFWDGAVLPMYAEASVRRPVHALVGSASHLLFDHNAESEVRMRPLLSYAEDANSRGTSMVMDHDDFVSTHDCDSGIVRLRKLSQKVYACDVENARSHSVAYMRKKTQDGPTQRKINNMFQKHSMMPTMTNAANRKPIPTDVPVMQMTLNGLHEIAINIGDELANGSSSSSSSPQAQCAVLENIPEEVTRRSAEEQTGDDDGGKKETQK